MLKRRRTRHIGRESGEALCDMMALLDWKPSTVIQVGVGRHYREIDAMRESWGEFILHGFEASPENAKVNQEIYPGTLHACAIGKEEGTVDFYEKERHANGATLYPHVKGDFAKSAFQKVRIDVKTLDGMFPHPSKLAGPVLLWLDCEGSELEALMGGPYLLPWIAVINVELTAVPVYDKWCPMMDVHNWLVEHDFLRQGTHTEDIRAGQCDAIYVRRALWKPEHCYCPCSFSKVEKEL